MWQIKDLHCTLSDRRLYQPDTHLIHQYYNLLCMNRCEVYCSRVLKRCNDSSQRLHKASYVQYICAQRFLFMFLQVYNFVTFLFQCCIFCSCCFCFQILQVGSFLCCYFVWISVRHYTPLLGKYTR